MIVAIICDNINFYTADNADGGKHCTLKKILLWKRALDLNEARYDKSDRSNYRAEARTPGSPARLLINFLLDTMSKLLYPSFLRRNFCSSLSVVFVRTLEDGIAA